jgi:hypothetical protein
LRKTVPLTSVRGLFTVVEEIRKLSTPFPMLILASAPVQGRTSR